MQGMATTLRDAGYGVEVVCALPNYPTGRIHPDYRGRLRVTEDVDGVRVHRLPILPSRARRGWRRAASMGTHAVSLAAWLAPRLLRRKPALVVVSSPPLPMAATAVGIARMAGCKVLLNVSDLWPLSALELGAVQVGAIYRWLEGVERRMYRRADAVMGQSEEILAHIGAAATKPAFLYRNLPAPIRLDAQQFSQRTIKKIVYAGQLGPVQGISDICDAVDFAAIGLELHLYGDGPEHARIASQISKHPHRGIFLHEQQAPADLADILNDYDSALVPLRVPLTGAVPSKLFSAVSAGLPVIFCGGREGERLVQEYSLGWTAPPGNIAALHDALRAVANSSSEEHQHLRLRCSEAARTVFSRTAQDVAFLQFLRGLL